MDFYHSSESLDQPRVSTPGAARSAARGFTLVEIMAATGIMLVIIMLILTLTTNVLSSWTRSSGQLQSNFEGRVALDLLTSDLESMVMRKRNICWLQVTYSAAPYATFTDAETLRTPILYFFAPTLERPKRTFGSTTDDILGDVCAISYRLAYKNPFTDGITRGDPPPPIFGLYRTVIDAESTFNQALAIENFDVEVPSSFLDHFWTSGTATAVDQNGNPVTVNNDWITAAENFLSANVVRFETIFWYRVGDGPLIPITKNGRADGTPQSFVFAGSGLYIEGSSDAIPDAQLTYVDITLTILSGEGATLLDRGMGTFQEILGQYGEVYSRRVSLMSRPL